jgi:hypothetical protein
MQTAKIDPLRFNLRVLFFVKVQGSASVKLAVC